MTIDKRLDEFRQRWIANPAAALEFAKLIEAVLNSQGSVGVRLRVAAFVAEQKEIARYLGIK